MPAFDKTRREIQRALHETKRDGNSSIRRAAAYLKVPPSSLGHHLQGRNSAIGRSPTHSLLSASEEEAVCQFAMRMDRLGLRLCVTAIRSCANDILKARYKDTPNDELSLINIPTVGER